MWTATATGIAAFVLSVINFVQLQRDARIDLALPAMVRIAQGRDYSLVFMQPLLSTRQDTDGVDVAVTMKLSLRGPGRQPQFVWDETGEWKYDSATGGLAYAPARDPAPMIVDRDTPQSPVARFVATGWRFSPGRYEGILEVQRADGGRVRRDFCLHLEPKDVVWLESHTGYDQYRSDAPPAAATRHGECYVAYDAYPSLNQPSRTPQADTP